MKLYKAWFGWGGLLEVVEVLVETYGANKYKVQSDTGVRCLGYRRTVPGFELHNSPMAALRKLQDEQLCKVNGCQKRLAEAQERLQLVRDKIKEAL